MSLATVEPSAPAGEMLAPVLSPRLALSWRQVAVCAPLAAFFVYLSYIPVFHSDIWGHVHYGHWIIEHAALPSEDPVMPLAAGMRVVDNAWLAQVLFARVEGAGGAAGLSALFALTVFATYLIYAHAFFRLSGSAAVMLAALAMAFLVGFSRHAIIRPEIFGGLFFAILLHLLTRVEPWRSRLAAPASDSPAWLWVTIPALFAVWANMHGSFAVGLAVLVCHASGRGIDTALRERSLWAPLRDAWFRRIVLLTELSVAATLLNPYGLDLLLETASFGGNTNLRDVMEWYPLKLIDLEGLLFLGSIAVMLPVLRRSRTRMYGADVLLLVLLIAAMVSSVRMIGWYAPVFAMVITPHLADLWRRRASTKNLSNGIESDPPTPAARPSFVPTLICGLLVWVAFAISPLSLPVLGGKPRAKELLYSKQTPHALTEHLHEHPPQGLVFGPQWWGDWLAYRGPESMQVFVTTNLHLAPDRVWRDYLQVARGHAGWAPTLDRYHVKTLVVHKELQPGLTRQVRRSPQWRVTYEDRLGMVAERVN